MSEIEIEIDGKKLQAKPDAMVIQVADEAGIYIPRFCYHKHLSIAANCRMCLVEVEKSGKPLPACATPVMPGMKVFTRSPKALAAQKAVMEFLLINHPLDCPICDQGGECELQDLSLGFGGAESFYHEGKRTVKDKDIGPLIATDMTRCIQCTRCVRFGAEVAGMRELGATGRGEDMEIGTYIDHAMKSEVSGNVIDLCPVGALTSKPFRFTARAWELEQRSTISPHDCVGSNLNAHMRYGKVMRVVPRENNNINETWISDRDRYSYESLYVDRIKHPLIKQDGKWQEASWERALEVAIQGIQDVLSIHGNEQIGALASASATVEEFYLLQKVMRGLGSSNVDHRLRQVDFSDSANLPLFPGLNMSIAEIEQCDTLLLIGSNIQKEQPALALRVRKATRKGTKILAVNPFDFPFHFDLTAGQIVSPDNMTMVLAGIAQALLPTAKTTVPDEVKISLANNEPSDADKAMAKILLESKKAHLVLGSIAINHPQAATIRALSELIAKLVDAQCGYLTEGANTAGAWQAGAIPHRGVAANALPTPGLDAQAMLRDPRKAYFLLNVEPDLDVANPMMAIHALEQAQFVVSLSIFRNAVIENHANVILPIAPFTETSGTYVNAAGEWQTFKGVASAYEEAKPAWKVLRVLGNLFHLEGFDHESSEEVRKEIKFALEKMHTLNPASYKLSAENLKSRDVKSLYRVGTIPIYATDSLTRRAKALQAAQPIVEGEVAAIRIHPAIAAKHHIVEGATVTVKQKQGEVTMRAMIDARLPERGVYIPGGILETQQLSELFGQVELKS